MKIAGTLPVFILFILSTTRAQTYDSYFLNKVKSDSLRAMGKYVEAIPNLRTCVMEKDMVTVDDEFFLGYAFFKNNQIDSAAMFMRKALNNNFHFHDTTQFNYWDEAGVFARFEDHESLRGLRDILKGNILKYIDPAIDSSLLAILLKAREDDQRYRGADLNYKKQRRLDSKNQELLRDIVSKHGWPSESTVGYEGSNAAFLIAQHSDEDPAFQQQCVRNIRDAYYAQKIHPSSYAYIVDRTRVNSGRSQLFGTQFETGKAYGELVLHLKPVEGETNLAVRRKVFLLAPIEEYLKESREHLLKYGNR